MHPAPERLYRGWTPEGVAGANPVGGAAVPENKPDTSLSSVLAAQRALNELGVADPNLKEDGVTGPKTRDAIPRFQTEHLPLVVDGLVGPKTRAALIEAIKAHSKALTPGM